MRRQNPFSFSAQLLCTVQQLRDRIFIGLFSDHGFLLQSEYLPGRRVSAPCKRTAASDLPDPQKYPVSFLEGDFDKERFYDMAKGLERFRKAANVVFSAIGSVWKKTAQLAKEHGFDYFCTTLSISPLKNAQKLNEIGEELADTYGIPWLPSDFKRKMVINVPSSFQLFMVCTGRTTAAACSQKKNENARLHLNLFDFAFL